jgi:hypothetical protein
MYHHFVAVRNFHQALGYAEGQSQLSLEESNAVSNASLEISKEEQ